MGKVAWMPIDVAIHGYYNPRSMTKLPRLLKVEEKAQNLLERSISHLLGESTLPRELARKLVTQAEMSQYQGKISDRFWILLSPGEMEVLLRASPLLEDDLSSFLTSYAEDADFSLLGPIKVIFVPDEGAEPRNRLIAPGCAIVQTESTKAMQAIDNESLFEDMRSLDAFLIDGARHIPLDRPTSTIGRHLENDIVLDNKTVSRRHAQIRWRHGKFVIHDLGSKIGLQINGITVRESVLGPGDVIKIGENTFVYGEGLTPVDHDARFDLTGSGTTQTLDGKIS